MNSFDVGSKGGTLYSTSGMENRKEVGRERITDCGTVYGTYGRANGKEGGILISSDVECTGWREGITDCSTM